VLLAQGICDIVCSVFDCMCIESGSMYFDLGVGGTHNTSVFITLAFLQPNCSCTCVFNPKGHQTLLYFLPQVKAECHEIVLLRVCYNKLRF
jgi:hypothetical protein